MKDSRSSLIRSVMAWTSPRRTASHSRSIKGSTTVAWVFMRSPPILHPIRPSVLLQISVSRQPFLIAPQQGLRLLEGHALGPQGRLGGPPHLGHQLAAVVAHVAQHVGDRVAVDHAFDAVVVLLVERDVDGV